MQNLFATYDGYSKGDLDFFNDEKVNYKTFSVPSSNDSGTFCVPHLSYQETLISRNQFLYFFISEFGRLTSQQFADVTDEFVVRGKPSTCEEAVNEEKRNI